MGYGGSQVLNPEPNCFATLMDATPGVRNRIKEFIASYNFSSKYFIPLRDFLQFEKFRGFYIHFFTCSLNALP